MAKLEFGNQDDNNGSEEPSRVSSKSNSYNDFDDAEKKPSLLSGWKFWVALGATAVVVFAMYVNYTVNYS